MDLTYDRSWFGSPLHKGDTGALIVTDITQHKTFLQKGKKQSKDRAFAKTHEEESENLVDFLVKNLISEWQAIKKKKEFWGVLRGKDLHIYIY